MCVRVCVVMRWQVLRYVGGLLGLTGARVLVKRAIQFGSLVAKQSNTRFFGSNRQGSGSATFDGDDDG